VTPALACLLLLPWRPVTASYYGAGFHGRLTASGAVFDAAACTAASPSLPFGTELLVGYRRRAVLVMVNDRGPWATDSAGAARWPLQPHPTRQLDLSAGAAKALHMCSAGVATVRVCVTREGE
jgi:rare lipoprotein A